MEAVVGVIVLVAVTLIAIAIGKRQGKQPPAIRPIRIPKPKLEWSTDSKSQHHNSGDNGGEGGGCSDD